MKAIEEVREELALAGKTGYPENFAPGMAEAGRLIRNILDAATTDFAQAATKWAEERIVHAAILSDPNPIQVARSRVDVTKDPSSGNLG